MKPANLESLKEKIIRPDFDKHLIPLLLYKGSRGIGWIHRGFNFAITMMESECGSFKEATKMSRSLEYAHLCGNRKPVEMQQVRSLFSRLRDHPEVTNNIPGLTEYCREVDGRSYHLTPVSIYADREKRKAPWRVLDPYIAAWREHRVFLRNERLDNARRSREERSRIRLLAKEQRLAWIAEKKAERDKLRADRRIAKEAEKARRKLASSPRALFYPYLIHKPSNGDKERQLLLAVHDAVPKRLPDHIRADVCQDLIVAVLSGDISQDDLRDSSSWYVGKVIKQHPFKYGHLSLDAILGEDDDRTLYDKFAPTARGRMEY